MDLTLALIAVFASVALLIAGRRRLPSCRAPLPVGGACFALQMPARAACLAAGGVLADLPNSAATASCPLMCPKSPKEMTRLQRRLAEAGFHGFTPVLVYAFCRDRVGAASDS